MDTIARWLDFCQQQPVKKRLFLFQSTELSILSLSLSVPANRNLAVANMPVMSRDLCNAVENPAIRGVVFDQHMCVGDVILVNANCNVRNESEG